MRVRILLVFFVFCGYFAVAPAYARATDLPATLNVFVRSQSEAGKAAFEQTVRLRMADRSSWTVVFAAAPQSEPCTASTPRANLGVTLTTFSDTVQTADIVLTDCAAWPVEQWTFSAAADEEGSHSLAAQAIFALRLWQHREPARFGALFDSGDATPHDGACHPELSLVKTTDGDMRAVVRPGGLAYDAGLRSNNVIEHIDGRDWWQYGTYRSQLRALDGFSHTYTVAGSDIEHSVACPKGPIF